MRRVLLALAAVAAFAGGATPAIAHQGNWTTQYQETYRYAVANCVRYSNWRCDGTNVQYVTSGEISDHSRRFVWRAYGINRTVAMYFDIGHTNSVFNSGVSVTNY